MESVQKKRWIVRIAVLLAALLLAGTALYVFAILPRLPATVSAAGEAESLRGLVGKLQEVKETQESEIAYASFPHKAIMEIRIEAPTGETLEEILAKSEERYGYGKLFHYCYRDMEMDDMTLEREYETVSIGLSDWSCRYFLEGGSLYTRYKQERGEEPMPDAPVLRNAILVDIQNDHGRYVFKIFSSGRDCLRELVAACVEEANAMIAEQSAP